jgi:hypothetical protein
MLLLETDEIFLWNTGSDFGDIVPPSTLTELIPAKLFLDEQTTNNHQYEREESNEVIKEFIEVHFFPFSMKYLSTP